MERDTSVMFPCVSWIIIFPEMEHTGVEASVAKKDFEERAISFLLSAFLSGLSWSFLFSWLIFLNSTHLPKQCISGFALFSQMPAYSF